MHVDIYEKREDSTKEVTRINSEECHHKALAKLIVLNCFSGQLAVDGRSLRKGIFNSTCLRGDTLQCPGDDDDDDSLSKQASNWHQDVVAAGPPCTIKSYRISPPPCTGKNIAYIKLKQDTDLRFFGKQKCKRAFIVGSPRKEGV